MFSGGGTAPRPPDIQPPAKMPDPFDPAVMEAKRRAAIDTMSRGGRQSTILGGSKLGGGTAPAATSFDSFSGKVLGG